MIKDIGLITHGTDAVGNVSGMASDGSSVITYEAVLAQQAVADWHLQGLYIVNYNQGYIKEFCLYFLFIPLLIIIHSHNSYNHNNSYVR